MYTYIYIVYIDYAYYTDIGRLKVLRFMNIILCTLYINTKNAVATLARCGGLKGISIF